MAIKAVSCLSGIVVSAQSELPLSVEGILASAATSAAKLPLPITAQRLFDSGAAEALLMLMRKLSTALPNAIYVPAGVLREILELLEARHIRQLVVRGCISLVVVLRQQFSASAPYMMVDAVLQCLQCLTLYATAAEGLERLGVVDAVRGALKHYNSEVDCLRMSCLILRDVAASGTTRAQVTTSGLLDVVCELMKPVLRSEEDERIAASAAFCGLIRNLAIEPENRRMLLQKRWEFVVEEATNCVLFHNMSLLREGEAEDEAAAWAAWSCLAAISFEHGACCPTLVHAAVPYFAAQRRLKAACSARVAWAVCGVLLQTIKAAASRPAGAADDADAEIKADDKGSSEDDADGDAADGDDEDEDGDDYDDGDLLRELTDDTPVAAALARALLEHAKEPRVVSAAAAALHCLFAAAARCSPMSLTSEADQPSVKDALSAALREHEGLATAASERAIKHVRAALHAVASTRTRESGRVSPAQAAASDGGP